MQHLFTSVRFSNLVMWMKERARERVREREREKTFSSRVFTHVGPKHVAHCYSSADVSTSSHSARCLRAGAKRAVGGIFTHELYLSRQRCQHRIHMVSLGLTHTNTHTRTHSHRVCSKYSATGGFSGFLLAVSSV